MTFSFVIFVIVFVFDLFVCFFVSFLFKMCTVGLYVSLCLMIFLCPFLHCKALRTAMYKRYINSIIIIIITCITLFCTFLSCFCTTSTSKCLISRFKEDVNKQRRNFISLPELEYAAEYGHLKFSFRRVRLHLTK